jgi:hypothetical protein
VQYPGKALEVPLGRRARIDVAFFIVGEEPEPEPVRIPRVAGEAPVAGKIQENVFNLADHLSAEDVPKKKLPS